MTIRDISNKELIFQFSDYLSMPLVIFLLIYTIFIFYQLYPVFRLDFALVCKIGAKKTYLNILYSLPG